jgi:hypothetical protein
MKSQSNIYPTSSIYDSDHIAIPVNISEVTINNQMENEEPQTGYSYDLVITPVVNAADVFKDTKSLQLLELSVRQATIQDAGFTCSNNIKLQVDEFSLNRWSQLMTGILAFQPPTVSIIDYNNDTHILPTSEVNNMLSEVFSYIQEFIIDTRTKKNLIINLT